MDLKYSAPYLNEAISIKEQIYIGKDSQDLLLIFNGEDNMLESYRSFISKIFESVNYSLDDQVYISNSSKKLYDIIPLCRESNITKIIDFGKSINDIGFKVKPVPYKPFKIGSIDFIYCDDIDKIHSNNALKNKLWNAMKKIFNEQD